MARSSPGRVQEYQPQREGDGRRALVYLPFSNRRPPLPKSAPVAILP